jgi:transposase-like protein
MAKTNIRYTPEFKRQLVDLVRAGRKPAELSREFGPTAWTISLWVRQDARDRGKADAHIVRTRVRARSDPGSASFRRKLDGVTLPPSGHGFR